MTSNLTYESVLRVMERVVQEKGEDYVYPNTDRCFYSNPDGTPSCILGYVFAELEPKLYETLREYEADHDESIGVNELDDTYDYRLIHDLSSIQESQDKGSTWGEVLEEFRTYAENREHINQADGGR